MKTKGTPKNRLCRIVSIPMKALVKAKDFYVRSMINCSDRGNYGGIGAVHSAPLPRSFSSRSSSSSSYSDDREFVELVRAASRKGSLDNRMDVEFYLRQHQMMMMQKKNTIPYSVGRSRKMPRSSSVAMGKIDEDEPYVFGEDDVVDVRKQMKFPRSRSYAPFNRTVVL
ncbi:hypothetical protein LIER_31698 [Lithospermum erythrorhizon]|uniref:Uncharacterized protein n=1 Tax=Lithospermum erythrorhizon TaxID=34254 RepID=A0AAV3RUV2_LITER